MASTLVVPTLRRVKDAVEVLVGHDAERVEHFVFDRLDHPLNVSLQVGRPDRRQLDLAIRSLEHIVKRIHVLSIAVPHQDLALQVIVVNMHLKVASLLRRPLARRVLGARRDPNLPRAKMNENHEVNVDQSLERPLLLASEIALPQRVGVAFEELVPCVRVVAWRRCEAGVDDHVLHRLTRNVNAHPPQLLQDLRVTEAGFLSDPQDGFTNVFKHLRPARSFLRGCLRWLWRVVLHLPNPAPERRVRHDRHHVFDLPAQLFAVFDQRVSFTIVQRDATG